MQPSLKKRDRLTHLRVFARADGDGIEWHRVIRGKPFPFIYFPIDVFKFSGRCFDGKKTRHIERSVVVDGIACEGASRAERRLPHDPAAGQRVHGHGEEFGSGSRIGVGQDHDRDFCGDGAGCRLDDGVDPGCVIEGAVAALVFCRSEMEGLIGELARQKIEVTDIAANVAADIQQYSLYPGLVFERCKELPEQGLYGVGSIGTKGFTEGELGAGEEQDIAVDGTGGGDQRVVRIGGIVVPVVAGAWMSFRHPKLPIRAANAST